MSKIKDNFFWGGAISANQSEGSWNSYGKGPSVADIMMCKSNLDLKNYSDDMTLDEIEKRIHDLNDANYPKRQGIDFYHRFKEDIAMLSDMSINMFRVSISWSRLFPKGIEKEPNKEGIDFYKSLFKECQKNGIEPLVTLSHYEMPIYLVENFGGWSNRKILDYYVNYCTHVFKNFSDVVHYWIPFNEIDNTIRHPFISAGIHKEIKTEKNIYQAMHYQYVASAKITDICKRIDPYAKIGCMTTGIMSYPYSCRPNDVELSQELRHLSYLSGDVQLKGEYPNTLLYKLVNDLNIDITEEDLEIISKNTGDFLAFSYYMSITVGNNDDVEKIGGNTIKGLKNPYLETSSWGWQIDPIGLRTLCKDFYNRYNMPLMIVENGLGARDIISPQETIEDDYRIKYHKNHLIELMKTIKEDHIDILGYLSWGIIDVVSSSSAEMEKRYGFIYVDLNNQGKGTLKRIKKKSFYWYKKVIESNGEILYE